MKKTYYLNQGGEDLKFDLEEDVFVDKSMLLSFLNKRVNTINCNICVASPKRFGKTTLGHLITAYYSRNHDTRHLFDNLKFSQDPSFEKYLNKFHVISFNISEFYDNLPGDEFFIQKITRAIARDLKVEFPDVQITDDMTLADMIRAVYKKTEQKFIFLIDEYDLPIRYDVPKSLLNDYLRFLCSLFKATTTRTCIALAYITGVHPVIRTTNQSGLNNFDQYNLLSPGLHPEFLGFTEQETIELCHRFNKNYEEIQMHHGNFKCADGTPIYSPYNICYAMTNPNFTHFWSMGGSFWLVADAIKDYDYDFSDIIIKLLLGERVSLSTDSFDYSVSHFNNYDDVLTLAVLQGFLAYDDENHECYIQNDDIRDHWRTIAEMYSDKTKPIAKFLGLSYNAVEATFKNYPRRIFVNLKDAHDTLIPPDKYNDQSLFQDIIIYAFFDAQDAYAIYKNLPSGTAYATVAFLPKYPSLNLPAIIVELKEINVTNSTLQQIEQKTFDLSALPYRGPAILVSVSYDDNDEYKRHYCQITPTKIE